MSLVVRWGLLGTAHINRRIVPAIRTARRSALAAIASRSPERADAGARHWEIPVAHGSYEALLHDRQIDAVYIPLPNALHVEWTLRALDAGKHVLCEKPLALSADDVDRIAAVARARRLVVAEGFMFRHEPLTSALLSLLAEQPVGAIRTMATVFTYPQQRAHDVRLDPALGGGSLWDVGCYCASIVRLVAGREPVAALGLADMGPSGVDQSFSGLLQFPDGIVGSLHCGFRAASRTVLEIGGTVGSIRVANPFKPGPRATIEVEREGVIERVDVAGSAMLFVRQFEDFAAVVLDGRPAVVTLADSRGNAAALAALHRAAQTGGTIQI